MAEATDADNANTVGGLDTIASQGFEDGRTSAHHGRRILQRDSVRDGEEERFTDDGVGRQRPGVQALVAVRVGSLAVHLQKRLVNGSMRAARQTHILSLVAHITVAACIAHEAGSKLEHFLLGSCIQRTPSLRGRLCLMV